VSSDTLSLMVRRHAQRAVSNHRNRFGLVAILRDALASLGLLRMRSERVERFTRSKAGTQSQALKRLQVWIPASAGMNGECYGSDSI
jgi:hypothetical protein